MDSYRPQSPDLSAYAPQSPDLSAFHHPQSPDLTASLPAPPLGTAYQHHQQPHQHQHHSSHSRDPPYNHHHHHSNEAIFYPGPPTSAPLHQPYEHLPPQPPHHHFKPEQHEDQPFLTDIPPRRTRKAQQALPSLDAQGFPFAGDHSQLTAPLAGMSTHALPDPTLGVQLRTSFPVARIKRIMQADEDIGKVAQVTPHVVSRALELFMIKLISSSAAQARGIPSGGAAAGGASKGPRRISAQHLKKAVQEDETFDFLAEIVGKVPDAPSKTKREVGSDSDEGGGGGVAAKVGRKKGKRRKDSGDEF